MYENLKEIVYDNDLQLEAYQFNGIVQIFPTHFHEYYVIGLIEEGERQLTVNNHKFPIGPGDLITFNPMDNHACEQTDGKTLRYKCLNLNQDTVYNTACDVLGCRSLPRFSRPVQYRFDNASIFSDLHNSIMGGAPALEREELYLLFMQQLLTDYTTVSETVSTNSPRKEIDDVCVFLEQHYDDHITLDRLSHVAKMNKYGLIRLFTQHKGITPYRYLKTIRIGEAKKLLEEGIEPAQVAQRTGFSDQSHFSNYFSRFIGLSPGQYQSIFLEGKL